MTVGKLLELMGSKAGVLEGRFHYGTGKLNVWSGGPKNTLIYAKNCSQKLKNFEVKLLNIVINYPLLTPLLMQFLARKCSTARTPLFIYPPQNAKKQSLA